MASVDSLHALFMDYRAMRSELPADWFRVDGNLAHNADFVSMSPDVLDEVSNRREWFEMKILRQYQTIYGEALNRMRDVNYLVAINTRKLAERAAVEGDEALLKLCVKFFNTYLRATINAKDVRTAYNVLNQYRLLADELLNVGGGATAVEIARYFRYYGRVSFDVKLPFILETVAYDLCALNETAFDRGAPVAHDILKIFLEVDKESEGEVQEASLRGVRKAQVKLATHYLLNGNEEWAREIHRDMCSERPERMAGIRDELLAVQSRDFWEISDRGVNFDYLPPEQKQKLIVFFGWFGSDLPSRRTISGLPLANPGSSGSIRPTETHAAVLSSAPGVPVARSEE